MFNRVTTFVFLCSILIFLQYFGAFAAKLDPGFGNDGRVAVELGVYGNRANAVVVQEDGKILVAGSSSNNADLDFMLFRLLDDGALDPDFNFDGTVTTAIGSFDDEILALVAQDDGKIIVVGYSSNGTDRDFAMARYYSDGSIDRNFGMEGMVVTAVGNSDDEITDVALTDDGSIIVTGSALGTTGRVIVLVKYRADGTLDIDFGDDGFTLIGVGKDAQAESIGLTEDQRIIVSGTYSDGDKRGVMIVGFDPNGQVDEGFGDNGIGVSVESQFNSEGYGMAIREDGRILVAGSMGDEGERDAALFQFTAKGAPDSSFEDNGVLVTDVGGQDDVLYDVIDNGTMIAASGYKTVDQGREFLFITYENSKLTVQQPATEQDSDSLLRITQLQVEDSYEEYQEEAGKHVVDVVSTEFNEGEDTATALAAMSASSVVVVGVSGVNDITSAAVTKYNTESASQSVSTAPVAGSASVLTGEPFDVTRTTAIIPVQIVSGIGTVTQRGVVFSTMTNPILKDGTDGDGTDDGDDGDDEDGETGAPVRSNLSPSGTVTTTSVYLSLTTDVNATCRYSDSGGVAYSSMTDFDSTGGTSHSEPKTVSDGTSYTYYVKCQSLSTGEENTTDAEISFTVNVDDGGGDFTPPSISNTTSSSFELGDSVTLSVSTNEYADCRYNQDSDTTYSSMANAFSGTATTTHSSDLGTLDADAYTYFARCEDMFGNQNSSGTEISFTVNDLSSEPVITNTTATSFLSTTVTLSITTDEAAGCKYNKDSDVVYVSMSDFFSQTGDTSHTETLLDQAAGDYTYFARCQDSEGVSNSSGTEISFSVSGIAPPVANIDRGYKNNEICSDSVVNTVLTSAAQSVGSLFVATAMAADNDTSDSDFLEEGYTSEGSGSGVFNTRLTDLKPGTFFYARAYAVIGGVTQYGNQVGFRTADSCFVATAAFGSFYHPYVQVLREFRDRYMFGNQIGRSLVNAYYSYSHPVADMIEGSSTLRLVARVLLLPVVGAAWLALQLGMMGLLLLLTVSGAFCWYALRPRFLAAV